MLLLPRSSVTYPHIYITFIPALTVTTSEIILEIALLRGELFVGSPHNKLFLYPPQISGFAPKNCPGLCNLVTPREEL